MTDLPLNEPISRPRILVDPGSRARQSDWDRLAEMADLLNPADSDPLDESQLIRALAGCQGLIRLGKRMPEVSRRVIEASPDLKIIAIGSDRFGTGVDLAAAAERDIAIVDVDNIACAASVAEWVLALVLICLRNGAAVYRQMVASTETWANPGNEGFVAGELTERKVGLIGCGHVGQRLVELLEPFRVDLLVADPYLSSEVAARLSIRPGSVDEVLNHAEILVVQVPLTPRTRGLIGARELDRLGSGKILINCSRGAVLNQAELIRRLERGDLIAGLDVFDPEPLEGASPLRSLPNVFLSPHIAWHAPNALHRCFMHAAQELDRFFRGEPLHYRLTPTMLDIRHGRI